MREQVLQVTKGDFV
ncbi:DUF3948 family protein, partial [Bacillus paranthracis]